MLPPGRFHPFDLDTVGLGAVLRAAIKKRPRSCIIGVGGSATNDGGFGLARAMGWRFLDQTGREIDRWTELDRLARIVAAPAEGLFRATELLVATDVSNPLLGPQGASRIYGPQKGLLPRDFKHAEACLSRLAGVAKSSFRRDFARAQGAGAAGGLGFGLMAFLGAKRVAGFELLSQYARLEERVRAADCVITGEGAVDGSTFMGKGVGQLAALCRKIKRPCIALGGVVALPERGSNWFLMSRGITDLVSVRAARARPRVYLARLARNCANELLK